MIRSKKDQTRKYRGKRGVPLLQIATGFGMMGFWRPIMRHFGITALLCLSLAACAGLQREPPRVGDSPEAVLARMGQPTARLADGAGQVFEYATGPMGQATWMARFGPDGRLASFEQVMSAAGFARIRVDQATKADVLRLIGHPAERSRVALHNYEVWSYRYKESGVWDSMMHVHFDESGVVRMMMSGPDPMYDKRYWRE